jgi:hypothetical protein
MKSFTVFSAAILAVGADAFSKSAFTGSSVGNVVANNGSTMTMEYIPS